MGPRQHISAALSQLRLAVSGCAIVFMLACVTQLGVFACVHFTDLRWQQLEPTEFNRPMIVTAASDDGKPGIREMLTAPPPPEAAPVLIDQPPAEPVDPNRLRSTTGVVLEHLSEGAAVLGVFSAASLCVLTLLGAVVAGGGAVPGVDRAVSAGTWGLAVVMLALPWKDVYASMPFAGVFNSYTSMVQASESPTQAAHVIMLLFIGLPVVAMLAALVVGFKFAAGVERGIIAPNTPDDVDMAMADSVKHVGSTHQIGAMRDEFRSSFGGVPRAPVAAEAPVRAPHTTAEADPAPARSAPPRRRSSLNPSEEEDWKRPI